MYHQVPISGIGEMQKLYVNAWPPRLITLGAGKATSHFDTLYTILHHIPQSPSHSEKQHMVANLISGFPVTTPEFQDLGAKPGKILYCILTLAVRDTHSSRAFLPNSKHPVCSLPGAP